MIKMSKTIQLSWAIDYSDPHFSGNGKSFNQDQARSKIFKSPLFLCRFDNIEYEVRHLCFIQELNSKRGKQERCENLAQFCSECNSHLSTYGWICPRACSDSETKENSLQFLILSNWETALLFVCECQKSDRLLVGMTG